METPEARAEQLFGEALDVPREGRTAFLERACGGAAEMRLRVEALLAEHDRLSGFLVEPILAAGAETIAEPAAERGQLDSGTRLGRYVIEERLGAGAMGVVYRARDEKLERSVALKTITPGMLAGDEARRHFRREALALARLNHPCIAAVYDAGEQDGVNFIVMEYVRGESLAAKLRSGAMGAREATAIVLEIAEAMEEAHEQGVIHRDLKPANAMVTAKNHVKVLDFGLARMLAGADATQSMETQGLLGTPQYMSPEQALGKPLDARSDLWSLGALYYELLAGKPPFEGGSSLAVLQRITQEPLAPLRGVRPDIPQKAEQIVDRALRKDTAQRYQSAVAMARDLRGLLEAMSGPVVGRGASRSRRWVAAMAVVLAAALLAGGWWLYRRAAERRWAREEAIPRIAQLLDARQSLAAFLVLQRAEKILPGEAQLGRLAAENTETVSIGSDPAGAEVAIQDYLKPKSAWFALGTTPLKNVRVPKGYFRWKVSKPGVGELIEAPENAAQMEFPLAAAQRVPAGMVYVPAATWETYEGFFGFLGPFQLPPYYIDRYEVTNREYQQFVDAGGYANPRYWPAEFHENGRAVPWAEGVARFRDTTGRPGPATWAAGHYPEGHGDFPVNGVSWYEAAAYAAFAGKSLPVLGQWYQAAPPDDPEYTVQLSNISASALAPVGTYQGVGPYGTYDMAGNVREWVANATEPDLRFILGGSWRSQAYLYNDPEALPPFDRSDGNGFRCVRNLGPVPKEAAAPYHHAVRDFAAYKPASDEVFHAYQLLYAYPKTPLNVEDGGVVQETEDWREEKVTFDAAYNGERMAAYLFLPKRVRPPYQTVLFFPSARVELLPPDSSHLGDLQFFDYIVQSGRAVMYPVYQDTYERQLTYHQPLAFQEVSLTTEWYKDAARSLDYLATRQDIDNTRLAYLGVSMGAAEGVVVSTLLQDRLKTAIYLDGGYFLGPPQAGADLADFVPRMKIPVLMVNGRYDYTFSLLEAQDPMFAQLGTPAAEKSHVVLETPHDVTAQRGTLVKVVLDWLDRYLGRVSE
ncbi:MAG: bifunctional serine/threonine-protein kinase/formylglycine-generating enzyme family protein [Acidobacteriaceae bacterium]